MRKFRDNIGIIIVGFLFITFCLVAMYITSFKKEPVKNEQNIIPSSNQKLVVNELDDLDISFLKLNNTNKNVVYSPLSIKTALLMLSSGADANTKEEITNILNDYKINYHPNNKHISFANAFFIKNTYSKYIKDSYVNNLKENYDSSIIYDDFNTPDVVNNWVNKKTFNMIPTLFDSISEYKVILANALAINMDFKNQFQSEKESYSSGNLHELIYDGIPSVEYSFSDMEFNNQTVAGGLFSSTVNKYDIINALGENNIRTILKKEATKEQYAYIDQYIDELKANYGKASSSTDFKYYINDDVKVFSKELKKYGNANLEYVAIMPTNTELNTYINNLTPSDINKLIGNLKSLSIDDAEEGFVTVVKGAIPFYEVANEIPLINNLNSLGVKSAFSGEANFSKMSSKDLYVSDAKHKTVFEFSNTGIKAASVTAFGMNDMAIFDDSINYSFEVPIKEINLNFDKPFIYLIRDTKTSEVWFVGSLYETVSYDKYNSEHIKIG